MKTSFFNTLLLILILMTTRIHGQIVDDFSDGDFTVNPSWHGTDSLFVVNDEYQLQTNGSVPGVAWLSVPYNLCDTLEWSFMIGEKFSPSSKNFCDVFLCSDNEELVMARQGCFLRLGEAGSEDVVELMKMDDGVVSSICRGTDTFVSSSFTAYFKIRRYPDGLWEVFVDKTGEGHYLLETQGYDDSFSPVGYFGLVATYTASNAKRFFFDDLYIGAPVIDTEPPVLVSANVVDNHNILLAFSECLDNSSLNVENYHISDYGSPDSAAFNEGCSSVMLSFDTALHNDVLYELTIKSVTDISGNTAYDLLYGFIIYNVEPDDVLINEVLFNPVEPGVDYVELYNNSDKVVDISKLRLGSVKTSFPNPPDTSMFEICSEERQLMPGQYLLLSRNGSIVGEQYDTETDNFLDMKRFPSYGNDSGTVLLTESGGSVIDVMHYDDDMHYPLLYVTKGVSLERISFDKSSADVDNWHSASSSFNYGTPGYPNSVMSCVVETDDVVTVTPEIFSPDGDGFNETAGIFFSKENTGCTLNVNILDSYGRHVRRLVDNVLVSFEASFFWDGLDDNGSRASPGIYIVLTEVFTMNGDVRRYKNAVVVATK